MRSKPSSTSGKRRSKNLWISAFSGMAIGLCLLSFPIQAEDSKISVKAEVNKAFITIGDPLIYTVTVKRDSKIKLASSISAPSDPSFNLKKTEEFNKKEKNIIYEGKKFTLTAYGLGDYVLDPVEVQYIDAQGLVKTLQTDKIYVSVKSVAEGEEKNDIRGVKSVVKIPTKVVSYILITLAVLVGILVLLFVRIRKPSEVIREAEHIRSPEEEALFQLNRLFDSDLIRRGKIKDYYLQLTEILRIFFERRFKILAAESTTHEIMRMLRDKEVDSNLRDLITEVLESADLAKFARWKPEPQEIIKLNQKAKQIVEFSKTKEAKSGI